jgi:hypothetical protein
MVKTWSSCLHIYLTSLVPKESLWRRANSPQSFCFNWFNSYNRSQAYFSNDWLADRQKQTNRSADWQAGKCVTSTQIRNVSSNQRMPSSYGRLKICCSASRSGHLVAGDVATGLMLCVMNTKVGLEGWAKRNTICLSRTEPVTSRTQSIYFTDCDTSAHDLS